jgi:hypothetical protein
MGAGRNFCAQLYTCGPSSGYEWLIAMNATSAMLPLTLKDSVRVLLGRHLNQSIATGLYLDVPTIGSSIELVSSANIRYYGDIKRHDGSTTRQGAVRKYTLLHGERIGNFAGEVFSVDGRRIPSALFMDKHACGGIYLLR